MRSEPNASACPPRRCRVGPGAARRAVTLLGVVLLVLVGCRARLPVDRPAPSAAGAPVAAERGPLHVEYFEISDG